MFPTDLLVARRVGCGLRLTSKKRLLETLAELLASADTRLTPEVVFDHLIERERLGSTGLGHGIALPHARIPTVTESIGAFVQLSDGVDYDAIDNIPVDLAFALLVPKDANEMHLQMLSRLATMFSDPGLRADLRDAPSSAALLDSLQGWQCPSDKA